MEFLDRKEEIKRLDEVCGSSDGGLIVIWGRRRIGKTRLLIEWIKKNNGIYWVADESSSSVQRNYFSQALESHFPGFSDVEYPNWDALLKRLTNEARQKNWKGPLVIDEFPYLVSAAKELPSIFQRWIDHDAKSMNLTIVLSGSSQSMMQGLVLDHNAPLYGRAKELFRLNPLPISFIADGLGIHSHKKMIEAYALWGGIPRYWELASPYKDNILESACKLILNPMGPLHQEPHRLLLDETPSAISLRPILDVIGMGVNRLSEIAGRLNQPATSLIRPMHRLQDLGLVSREIPFGESEETSKKSLYKIKDPFFRFWFKVVAGRRGMLADASEEFRMHLLQEQFPFLISQSWEDLCLSAVSKLDIASVKYWMPAKRFWKGNQPEWDIVSQSDDKKYLLLGEVKWRDKPATGKEIEKIIEELQSKGVPDIQMGEKTIIKYCIFIPELASERKDYGTNIFLIDASQVINALT